MLSIFEILNIYHKDDITIVGQERQVRIKEVIIIPTYTDMYQWTNIFTYSSKHVVNNLDSACIFCCLKN